MPLIRKPHRGRNRHGHHSDDDESTPICRCRVLYLGSAVPHITKDGLQGIQEPLKELYPDTGLSSLKGIDSWLSVWSNGLLLENVDEKNTKITRFFPIESLHYCAAVRNVLVPASGGGSLGIGNGNGSNANGGGLGGSSGASSSSDKVQKFLPLDSPFARLPNLNHPPLFACILRRTTGIKVLECHAFICKREMAANALVRCCFHAYADSTYAKQLENGGTLPSTNGTSMTNGFNSSTLTNGHGHTNGHGSHNGTLFKERDGESSSGVNINVNVNSSSSSSRPIQRSVTPLDSIEKVTGWQALSQNGDSDDIIVVANSTDDDFPDGPMTSTPRDKYMNEYRGMVAEAEFPDEDDIYEGDENHKIWGGANSTLGHNGTLGGNSSELVYLEPDGTLKSVKSHNSRMSRPRQFMSPPPPPPPPPQFSLLKSAEEDAANAASNKKKTKKKLKKDSSKSQQQLNLAHHQQQMHMFHQQQQKYLIRPASMMNLSSPQTLNLPRDQLDRRGGGGMEMNRPGSVLNGPSSNNNNNNRPSSAMSTLQRRPQLIPVPQQNGFAIFPPQMSMSMPMHPQHMQMQPIYGHLPHHPPPHFAMHPGPHPAHPPQLVKGSKSKSKSKSKNNNNNNNNVNNQQQISPIPVLTPTPVPMLHHPHPHHHGRHSVPTPPPGMFHHHHQQQNPGKMIMQQEEAMMNHNQKMMRHQSNGEGPPSHYATIERGYHYHSRHSSMMNGDSATLVSNKSGGGVGGGMHHHHQQSSSSSNTLLRPSGSPPHHVQPHTAEGMKKEREIIQMVRDLDLSGDDIERQEVPPEFYPSVGGGSRKMMANGGGGGGHNGYRIPNGHGPRITHR